MRRFLSIVAVAAAALGAAPATAQAMLTTSGSTLIGATGLTIGGLDGTYDVSFVEGTCNDVFGDCSDPANFGAISTSGLATNAGTALLALIDTDGTFDQLPEYTLGCGASAGQCGMLIPYGSSGDSIDAALAVNNRGAFTTDSVGSAGFPAIVDTGTRADFVYARFTPSGPIVGSLPPSVPEPPTWAMMLVGFAGVGGAMRRKRSSLLVNA